MVSSQAHDITERCVCVGGGASCMFGMLIESTLGRFYIDMLASTQ